MSHPKTYTFEGQQRTMKEICAEVPALSKETIRLRLLEGRTDRVSMLSRPVPKPSPTSRANYSMRSGRT